MLFHAACCMFHEAVFNSQRQDPRERLACPTSSAPPLLVPYQQQLRPRSVRNARCPSPRLMCGRTHSEMGRLKPPRPGDQAQLWHV